MAHRLLAMGTPGHENGFRLSLRPERLQEPLLRKKPTIYFVNSMSDPLHEHVPAAGRATDAARYMGLLIAVC